MFKISATLPLWLLLCALASAVRAQAPEPLKVLYISGGCCHDYDTQADLIPGALEEHAHVQVTVINDPNKTTANKIAIYANDDWAKPYDVIIHNECYADTKDPEWTQRILKPHKEGKPGVVIHCAMHSYRDGTDEWFQFCGVTSHRHGAHYPHAVFNVNASHPVMQGFGPAWANPAGELYHIEKVWPGTVALGSSKNQENGREEVCVWAHEYGGRTRVFGTTLGHHNETVADPAFIRLLTRGTLWACDKLNDTYLKTPAPKTAPVNLALDKPAKASSTQKGNDPGKAFDGNAGTRWCADGASAPQWLQVDLGKEETLTGARLVWEMSGAVYRFVIEGSANGEEWRTLFDGSKNTLKGTQEPRFNAEGVRHVRTTFLGADRGSWGSLWEMEVHGTETRILDAGAARKAEEEAVLSEVKVPEGFEVSLFATPPAANYPVYVTAAPDGAVFVSVDKNGSLDREPRRGGIVRLKDLDGDGRADEAKLFVSDVDSPRGAVWDHDRLYVIHPPHLSVFIDKDGDGVSDEQKVLVKNIAFGFKDRPADHTTNGLTLGIDGWLYIAGGDFGFMEAEGTDGTKLQHRGGGVIRVRPDGTELQLYATGTRNILDVAMSPALDGFSRDNTNDGGGWDVRFHHFTGLEDHGYPRLYINFNDEIIQPLADYGGGSGCGGMYLNEPGFPAEYADLPLTCDWGRERIFSHHVTPDGATFKDDVREFIKLPRVTDIDGDAMSRLYAASWKGASFNYAGENVGYIIQVKPKGYTPEPLPDFDKADDQELVKLLESPSARRRQEAQRALIRRGLKPETALALYNLAADKEKPLYPRVAAMFAIKEVYGAKATPALEKLAADETIRALAIRAMADRPKQLAGVPVELVKRAAEDPGSSPRVKLEAAVALARLGDAAHAGAIAPLLGDSDPVIAHTAFQAMAKLQAADACFAVLDREDSPEPRRLGALRALMRIHTPAAVDGLISRLEKETAVERRRGLLAALCRLYFTEGEWKGDSWGTRPDTTGPYYQPEAWAETPKIAAALDRAMREASAGEAAWLATEMSRNRIRNEAVLRQILTLAANDAALLPAALKELAKADRVPAEALPLLTGAAVAEGTEAARRREAIAILLGLDGEEPVRAALKGLTLFKGRGEREEREKAAQAFLNAPKLENHHALLEHEAEKAEGETALWADAALLALSGRTTGSPEAKELSAKALDAGWQSSPERRARILRAIALARQRSAAERVLSALNDPVPAVAEAAREAARVLKLDASAAALPKIETLEMEQVLKAVATMKGDVAAGRQIFEQAGCGACHTVSKDEPQRGPFLGNIADIYKRDELAEAILNPNKTVAQGFATNFFELKDGATQMGFVTLEAADKVVIRTIAAEEVTILPDTIAKREKLPISLMPPGLMNAFTTRDLASLLDYLQSLAQKQ